MLLTILLVIEKETGSINHERIRYMMAHGPMTMVSDSGAVSEVQVFLFDDLAMCTSQRKGKYKLEWMVDIINMTLEER